MIVLGLTGSIGMGKTTTARMFREAGVPVYDADDAVHRLYSGPAAPAVEAAFPGAVRDGVVDRRWLSDHVVSNPETLRLLESIIHPMVRADETLFRERYRKSPLIVLDIPLLFETNGTDRVDKVLVVTAPGSVQKERVLSRPGMSPGKFEAVLARQVPDAEKRKQADFVIDTSEGMDRARAEVLRLIDDLAGEKPQGRRR